MSKLHVIQKRNIPVDGQDKTVYDFVCPYTSGCGQPGGRPFMSAGWFERQHAVERGEQHIAEHESGEPMQELREFWAERGLTQETAGDSALPAYTFS